MRELRLRDSGPPSPRLGWVGYAVLAVGVALLGVAGYVGYVTYPRFNLPSVAGAALLLLGAGAGVASFFSPCSFPLLLTLLARHVRGGRGRARARPVLVFAGAFSAGAVAFLALLGALIGLGGRGLVGSVTFTSPTGIAIRIVVGVLLVVLGLIQAGVLPVSFHGVERLTRPLTEAQARLRRERPVAGFALFGFSYLLIAFG
ncbi:MAG: cytochrome c biogenesis protein CcdA [Actinomycetota bacterium]